MGRKITALLLAALVTLGSLSSHISAAFVMPQTVRVGLEAYQKEKDTIAIANNAFTFGYEQNGTYVECGFLQGTLSAVPAAQVYVRLDGVYFDYWSAQFVAGTTVGYAAFPCFVAPNEWAVCVGFASEAAAAAAQSALGTNAVVLPTSTSRVSVTDSSGQAVLLFDGAYRLQIAGYGGDGITLGTRAYRGRIEFGRYAGKKLTAVNVVSLEEYLYSVVASEMPQSWHMEALKAQACAARTYTVTHISYHGASGYDVCDTTNCQVYTGIGGEAESSRAAVDATRGMLIYYDGEPITNAVFFSSSGGMTDNSENVWTATLPYLRGVPEIYEPTAKHWSITYTMAQLSTLMRDAGQDVGNVSSVTINRFDNNRVQTMTITGSIGSKSLTKEAIRSTLALDSRNFTMANGAVTEAPANAYVNQSGTAVSMTLSGLVVLGASGNSGLLSNAGNSISVLGAGNTITSIPLMTRSASTVSGVDAITFVGAGWGHGVGMSQHGAKGMAELGYSYLDILKYYYTGVEVR